MDATEPNLIPHDQTRTTWWFPWRPGTVRAEAEDEERFRVALPPLVAGQHNPCPIENGKLG